MTSYANSVNTPFPIGGGAAYPTQYAILTGNGTNAVNATVLTNGQILIGDTGIAPVAATITAGSGISVTNGAGSITIANTSTGLTWSTVSGTSQAAAVNSGYVVNNAGLVTVTLPSTAAVGDLVAIRGLGAGGFLVAQNSSQLIHAGTTTSTTGTGGSLASANAFDCVNLRCIVTNTTWTMEDAVTTGFAIV